MITFKPMHLHSAVLCCRFPSTGGSISDPILLLLSKQIGATVVYPGASLQQARALAIVCCLSPEISRSNKTVMLLPFSNQSISSMMLLPCEQVEHWQSLFFFKKKTQQVEACYCFHSASGTYVCLCFFLFPLSSRRRH